MFIVNVEGAIRKDNKWIIIERSHKEEHAAGLLSLVGGKVEVENVPHSVSEQIIEVGKFNNPGSVLIQVKLSLDYSIR